MIAESGAGGAGCRRSCRPPGRLNRRRRRRRADILTGDEELPAAGGARAGRSRLEKWAARPAKAGPGGTVAAVGDYRALVELGAPVRGLLRRGDMGEGVVDRRGHLRLRPGDPVEVRVAEGGVDVAAGRLLVTMKVWAGAEAEANREALEAARRIREREDAAAAARAAAAAAGEEGSSAAEPPIMSPFRAAWEKALRDAEAKAKASVDP